MPDEADLHTAKHVDEKHQPHGRDRRADRCEARGLVALAQPQPEDDGDGREVFDEHGNGDVEGLHRHEVEELRARDSEQSVRDDRAGAAREHVPAAPQRDRARDGEHESGDRHAQQHGGTGGPAQVHEALRKTAGQAE